MNKKYFLCLLVFVIILLLGCNRSKSYKLEWVNIDDISDRDSVASVIADNDDNILSVGYYSSLDYNSALNRDIILYKYNKKGKLIWNTTIDEGVNDLPRSVLVDEFNSIYIVGSIVKVSPKDYLIVKLSESGGLSWMKTYDNGYDSSAGGVIDSNNNIAFAGFSSVAANNANRDYFLTKLDNVGFQIWDLNYDNAENDVAQSIAVSANRNIAVTGNFHNGKNFDSNTILVDPEGNLLWEKQYDSGSEDSINSVNFDNEGNIIITGFTGKSKVSDDYIIIKYDQEGNLLWEKVYGGANDERALSSAIDSKSNVIVVGMSFNGKDYDIQLIGFDKGGNEIFSQFYDGGFNDIPHSVAIDSDDNIIIGGKTLNGENEDFITLKYKFD